MYAVQRASVCQTHVHKKVRKVEVAYIVAPAKGYHAKFLRGKDIQGHSCISQQVLGWLELSSSQITLRPSHGNESMPYLTFLLAVIAWRKSPVIRGRASYWRRIYLSFEGFRREGHPDPS